MEQHQDREGTLDNVGASQKGIDIQKAMSILSSRPQNSLGNDMNDVDEHLKSLGQTIDLIDSTTHAEPSSPEIKDGSSSMNNDDVTDAMDSINIPDHDTNESKGGTTKKSSEQLLKENLANQTESELLQTLFQLQKERVETYRKFNQGLDQVLKSGNISDYTHFTAEITATFSVISNSIRDVEQSFQSKTNKSCKDVSKWIRELQSKEREKLSLTAALHLEKLRERNEQMNLEMNEGGNGGNTRIVNLLQEGVLSLEKKIVACIEEINDVMEELRYCAVDLS